MGNYIVEDDIKNYSFPKKETPKSNNKSLVVFITIGVFIVVIFGMIISNRMKRKDYYSKIEEDMVESAKVYVSQKVFDHSKEIYLDTKKLDIMVPNNCNILSGVIYKDNEYTPYLKCNNYESVIVENNDMINLIGNSVILLTKGGNYYELGYNSDYNVQISGKVDVYKEGIYNIYYMSNIGNSFAIRKVIIVDNELANSYTPIINIPEEKLEIIMGEDYQSNITVIDKTDGNITDKLIKESNVNIDETGEYNNIFSATNSLGYTTMLTQKVIVLSNSETSIITKLSDDNMSNKSVSIIVNVIGDKYSHLILPNKEETKEKDISYEVLENGEYEFIAVNNDGSKISKVVKVTNIDRTTPEGTCSVIEYSDKLIFNVSISSFNYVVSYNYYNGDIESGYISNNSYTVNGKSSGNLSVKVRDYIGNEGTIKCSVSDKKSSLDIHGYNTVIRDKPRLHIPISDALSKKGYTVNDLNMCIYKRVQEAGPYTRYGVAAAAFGLIDCTYSMTGYVLPYNHTSGKVSNTGDVNYCVVNSDICGKLGINRKWGSPGGQCSSSATECWHGLNCATFVRWAMCNGGMDLCTKGEAGSHGMVNKTYFPEADGVQIKSGQVSYYCGEDLTKYSVEQLVRMIKPGDAMASDEGGGHAFVVVGYDQNGIYTAEDGYYMRYIKYTNIISSGINYRVLFLDKYYANSNNRNNLYG